MLPIHSQTSQEMVEGFQIRHFVGGFYQFWGFHG
jgi:hypothetical protein